MKKIFCLLFALLLALSLFGCTQVKNSPDNTQQPTSTAGTETTQAESIQTQSAESSITESITDITTALSTTRLPPPPTTQSQNTTASSSASAKVSWTTITINGDALFKTNTTNALNLIQGKAPTDYIMVVKYIGIIQQGAISGMEAYDNPPTFVVGDDSSQASVTWYASDIVHDAYHSKLYNDYLNVYGTPVPVGIWTGENAEMACLNLQISFLEEVGAPDSEIAYAKSLIGTDWWDITRTW